MGDVPLVEVDAVLRGGGGPLHIEQVQPVGDAGVGPGDDDVPKHRLHRPGAEGDGEGHPGVQQPAVRLDPGVGQLLLAQLGEYLAEQAVVVVQPHPVPGQAQGGDGVQEAGGQTGQAAVAQGGLGLGLLHLGQAAAPLLQKRVRLVIEAQGQQVVGEQLAQEKFRGEVVQLPLPLGGGAAGALLLGELQQRVIELAGAALAGVLLIALAYDLLKTGLDVHKR